MGKNKDHVKKTFFQMRITEDYSKQLKLSSEKGGFESVTEYLLYIIDKYENRNIVKEQSSGSFDDRGLGYHLSRLGNNLNQLAYNINKANLAKKVDDCLAKEVAREMMYLNIQIGNALQSLAEQNKGEA